MEEAAKIAINAGLNISVEGSLFGGTILNQSLPLGVKVKRGSVIRLIVLEIDHED